MAWAIIPGSPELNFVVVNGLRSPGRAQLTNVKVPYKWEVKEGYGAEGAFMVFRGRGISRPVLTLTLWRPEHFVEWAFFSQLLKPPTPLKPLVVDMRHPILASADIKSISVEEIGEPERQSNGTWV